MATTILTQDPTPEAASGPAAAARCGHRCSDGSPAAAAFFICSVLDCSSCVFNTMFCRQHDVLSWVLWMPIDRLKMLDSDPHMQCVANWCTPCGVQAIVHTLTGLHNVTCQASEAQRRIDKACMWWVCCCTHNDHTTASATAGSSNDHTTACQLNGQCTVADRQLNTWGTCFANLSHSSVDINSSFVA